MNRFAVSVLALLLAGCIGGSGKDATAEPAPAEGEPELPLPDDGTDPDEDPDKPETPPDSASCTGKGHREGGRHYRVELASEVDGEAIVFEVFEPAYVDCDQRHPLVLEGHGFGGSRQTDFVDSFMAPIATLTDAGYAVISIDQRGHGESGGTVRVMDPDHEGRDLVQIVDWAEANLDYLAYRDDNLLLGSVGGSYGGGFQYLLYAMDPKRRLDAMVPQITWHDLDYSLNPGGVPKSYWGLVLSGAGDSQTGFSMDPLLRSTLIESGLANRMPEVARDFFHYHSLAYTCGNRRGLEVLEQGDTSDYTFDPALQLLPVTAGGEHRVGQSPGELYPVDVLMFQGFRDSLFNMNEAWRNYECLKDAGGDVRLLTYGFGHHYLQPSIGLAQEGLRASETWVGSLSSVAAGDAAVNASCAGVEVVDATLAWFEEKLRGRGRASDVITSGEKVCISLVEGDDLLLDELPVGGVTRPVERRHGGPVLARTGLAGALPTLVPLGELNEDAVLAGIPVLDVTLDVPGVLADHCDPERSMLGGDCDAILFVGIGVLRNGVEPELINEQVMPIRGLGRHQVDLVAVAERLRAGDRLFLVLYGAHPNFVTGMSRDPAVLSVMVEGEVDLPLLDAAGGRPLSTHGLGSGTQKEHTPVSFSYQPRNHFEEQQSFTF